MASRLQLCVLMPKYAAVFIDHREAHVFHIAPDRIDEETVRVPQHLHRKHPKLSQGAKEHPNDAKTFFHALCGSLQSAEEILIVGPSTAKLDLVRYIHKNEHLLEPRIVGIETVDHPSSGQLIAYAKSYFGLDPRESAEERV
jgi:stalled ribosome rescue protein Dom34